MSAKGEGSLLVDNARHTRCHDGSGAVGIESNLGTGKRRQLSWRHKDLKAGDNPVYIRNYYGRMETPGRQTSGVGLC